MRSQVYLHLIFTIVFTILGAFDFYLLATLLALGRAWGILIALYFLFGKLDYLVVASIGPRGTRDRMHGWAKRAMRMVLVHG